MMMEDKKILIKPHMDIKNSVGGGVLEAAARPYVGARINLCAFYLIGLPVAVFAAFMHRYQLRGLWFWWFSIHFKKEEKTKKILWYAVFYTLYRSWHVENSERT